MGLLPKLDGEDKEPSEGGYKRLRDVHNHEHNEQCDHDDPAPPPATGIRGLFQRAAKYQRTIVFGGTAALLATTALTPGVLATTLGAGVAAIAALTILPFACHMLIDNFESIGKRFGMSAGVMGMALAAMESIPEFAVAVKSVASGAHSLAMGNIIGSNTVHVLPLLGAVAVLAGGIKSKGASWKFNIAALAGASTAFGTQLATGRLIEGVGYGMLAAAAAYVATTVKLGFAHKHSHSHSHSHNHQQSAIVNSLYAAGGLGAVMYTAHQAVDHAQTVALNSGIPEVMVGTLALGLGTAAPEFFVNASLALRGKTEMAVGNIIGCSVLNLLGVGGLLAASGAPVPEALQPTNPTGLLNLTTWGVGVGLASATLLANKGNLKRWHGFAALALYGAYLVSSVGLSVSQDDQPTPTKPAVISINPQ